MNVCKVQLRLQLLRGENKKAKKEEFVRVLVQKRTQTCMEPAMDDELKLPLMLSLFGYDFLYKKLEFDESIGGAAAVVGDNAVVDGDDDDDTADDDDKEAEEAEEDEDDVEDNDVGDTDAQFPLALLPVGPPPFSPMRDCRITHYASVCFRYQHRMHCRNHFGSRARPNTVFMQRASLSDDDYARLFHQISHKTKHIHIRLNSVNLITTMRSDSI